MQIYNGKYPHSYREISQLLLLLNTVKACPTLQSSFHKKMAIRYASFDTILESKEGSLPCFFIDLFLLAFFAAF